MNGTTPIPTIEQISPALERLFFAIIQSPNDAALWVKAFDEGKTAISLRSQQSSPERKQHGSMRGIWMDLIIEHYPVPSVTGVSIRLDGESIYEKLDQPQSESEIADRGTLSPDATARSILLALKDQVGATVMRLAGPPFIRETIAALTPGEIIDEDRLQDEEPRDRSQREAYWQGLEPLLAKGKLFVQDGQFKLVLPGDRTCLKVMRKEGEGADHQFAARISSGGQLLMSFAPFCDARSLVSALAGGRRITPEFIAQERELNPYARLEILQISGPAESGPVSEIGLVITFTPEFACEIFTKLAEAHSRTKP